MTWLENLLRRLFPKKPKAEVPLNEWPRAPIYGTVREWASPRSYRSRSYRSARAEPVRQSGDDNLPIYMAAAMMASDDSCNSSSSDSSSGDSGGSCGGGE